MIQKETIQPSVIHTTIPIHEVHKNEAKFENQTALPTMTMDEFNQSGNSLGGSQRRKDSFEGKPEGLGELINPNNKLGTIGGPGADGTTSMTGDLDPRVGPNRGSMPATSAQDNVAKRNDGVTARDTIDTNIPQKHHHAATGSSAAARDTIDSKTPHQQHHTAVGSSTTGTTTNTTTSSVPHKQDFSSTRSPAIGTTAPNTNTRTPQTQHLASAGPSATGPTATTGHSSVNMTGPEKTTTHTRHDSGKHGLLEKIKNVLH